jgi:hypothetical protein
VAFGGGGCVGLEVLAEVCYGRVLGCHGWWGLVDRGGFLAHREVRSEVRGREEGGYLSLSLASV